MLEMFVCTHIPTHSHTLVQLKSSYMALDGAQKLARIMMRMLSTKHKPREALQHSDTHHGSDRVGST